MAKQFKDKVAELKAIASGKQSLDALRPPQHHVVCETVKRGVKTYNIGQLKLDEQGYQQWYTKNVREDLDTVIHFVEFRTYKDEAGQIASEQWDEEDIDNAVKEYENSRNRVVWTESSDEDEDDYDSTVLEIHQEPIQAQQETKEQIREPIKEAQEEPVLRPLSEHIAFNEYMTKILTRSW